MAGNDNECYLMAMMKWETHDVKTKFSMVFLICRIKYTHIKRKYSYNTTSTKIKLPELWVFRSNKYETNLSKWQTNNIGNLIEIVQKKK